MSDSRESRRKTLEANRATLEAAEARIEAFVPTVSPKPVETEVTVQDSPPRPILAETGEKV